MSEILSHYHKVNPTTWVYLSSLLMIALFFKFSRVWSVRNLDLIGLIMLAPGLLCVVYGRELGQAAILQVGYIWLFSVGGFFLLRMLLDPLMVRRPLLEPNLSVGGLTFLGISLLIFLMANVVTDKPDNEDLAATSGKAQVVATDPESQEKAAAERFAKQGPGFPLLSYIPSISTRIFVDASDASSGAGSGQVDHRAIEVDTQKKANMATARTMAILSQLAIVIGMVVIGYRHFDNVKTGIAASVVYLLLPYTALMKSGVTHVLPAALLVWAILCYRRPTASGVLMGLAIGVNYYPMFLLPLWIAFYWQRGLGRFLSGVVSMLLVLTAVLYFSSQGLAEFTANLRQMYGFMWPTMEPVGFWKLSFNEPVYRIPVLAAFVAMCGSLAIWPAQKNLGTLLSCSAAVMLGTQFWNAHGGGEYMAWYLPLLLLTIFRPNLEDRVALSVLGEWRARRKIHLAAIDRAA
ncbi:MAG: hypothetical protein SGJ20_13940 [Planctomycetota bacterium]|nr:hypothetical protein [Planctomycetota bacterium]